MAPKPRPAIDRFAEKVALDESGCLIWLAYINDDGYGTFRPEGGRAVEHTFAHRWSYAHLAKTHCPAGHPYSGSNLYVYRWSRMCKTCRRDARRRYESRKAS